MRIMIKGGVWKNTEDEILKAAVMKYGLNQWARISSLLVRKSAKQCKARWYEWLDPSIKKTEWSQEEDEKLLHLSKIMPCQWRTIAPIVGRTPAQCLERYEQLLDAAANAANAANMAAAAADGNDADADDTDKLAQHRGYRKGLNAAGGAGGGAGGSGGFGNFRGGNRRGVDDPRRLRPGEIDPHPETKPARPDPIDMDEDEKEMLSEARARLANTKGKKAKRKAREKQLQEARRLASLQKRREMRAAGINVRRRMNRTTRKNLDYNAEIPFQRLAPLGFFDTSVDDFDAERQTSEARNAKFRPLFITDIEGERRDDIEERERKKDVARQRLLSKMNLPEAIARLNRLNDPAPINIARKKAMNLPKPQVSEAELEDIAKITGKQVSSTSNNSHFASNFSKNSGSNITKFLVNDENFHTSNQNFNNSNNTPGSGSNKSIFGTNLTPNLRKISNNININENEQQVSMRTPAARGDNIMEQAKNALKMRDAETPLLGGNDGINIEGTEWDGIKPKQQSIRTPNPLSSVVQSSIGSVSAASIGSMAAASTPGALSTISGVSGISGLTDATMMSQLSARQLKKLEKERMKRLKKGLKALPEPTNEFEIQLPELPKQANFAAQSHSLRPMFAKQLERGKLGKSSKLGKKFDNFEAPQVDQAILDQMDEEEREREMKKMFLKKSHVLQSWDPKRKQFGSNGNITNIISKNNGNLSKKRKFEEAFFNNNNIVVNDMLPRPRLVNPNLGSTFVEFDDKSLNFIDAKRILLEEMKNMITFDNHNFPIDAVEEEMDDSKDFNEPPAKRRKKGKKHSKHSKHSKKSLSDDKKVKLAREEFSLEQMSDANELLQQEMERLKLQHKFYTGHLEQKSEKSEKSNEESSESNEKVVKKGKQGKKEMDDSDSESDEIEDLGEKNKNENRDENDVEVVGVLGVARGNELFGLMEEIESRSAFVPRLKRFGFLSNKNQAWALNDKLEVRKQEFSMLRRHCDQEMMKTDKNEKNINIHLRGYEMISKEKIKKIGELHRELKESLRNLEVYSKLCETEEKAIPKRSRQWRNLIEIEKKRERELQEKYEQLLFKLRQQ